MTRPATLSEAAERVRDGVAPAIAVSEFLDTFYYELDGAARAVMLHSEPPPTGDARTDALMGAICEYLAKRYALPGPIPPWANGASRFLPDPWFTTSIDDDGMREFLTFSSPAEFRRRNIFTEGEPLRRASQNARRTADGPGAQE